MNKKAEKILNTTIKLFIDAGVKKTTIDDIAEKADVSKVTIYKYFIDKNTLCLKIGRSIISSYTDKLNKIIESNENLIKKLYNFLDVISCFFDNRQYDLCIELAKYNQDVETEFELYSQKYRESIFYLIDSGMKDGLFKNSLDREIIFYYIDMGILYYRQNSVYRNKILNDNNFKERFLLFQFSNIFIDGEKILLTPDMVTGKNILQYYMQLAKEGTKESIAKIMKNLNPDMTIGESKIIDYALGHVEGEEGFKIMEYYLFHGTQIQRNYCTLYFARREEYQIIRKAYDDGLIDAKQAFSR